MKIITVIFLTLIIFAVFAFLFGPSWVIFCASVIVACIITLQG